MRNRQDHGANNITFVSCAVFLTAISNKLARIRKTSMNAFLSYSLLKKEEKEEQPFMFMYDGFRAFVEDQQQIQYLRG